MNDDQALRDFVAKYARPYDPESDDYDRPPFAADIKEGKNDPIYNAHSYHTKVPPRGIIPYILHYTKPGDLILDPFCGSGMTGVAAQMCANPPADLLEQFPELKDRVGLRHVILNDLSPAACHIAYNYNTEHYEPAVGLYDLANADVAGRLKNPPSTDSMHTLLGSEERLWELLTKAEVEARLGYPVTDLPHDKNWGDLDVSQVQQWVCIPATIQYTIWSDVYRCEGFVTIEEPTGKISTRGKNVGKPIVAKNRMARGCGNEVILWKAAVESDTSGVKDEFNCPHCGQAWTKYDLDFVRSTPVHIALDYVGIKGREVRVYRPISEREKQRVRQIEEQPIQTWYPDVVIYPFRELMSMGVTKHGVSRIPDFYTKRNLRALSRLWAEATTCSDTRVRNAIRFVLTSTFGRIERTTCYNFRRRGNKSLSALLYIASITVEDNISRQLETKIEQASQAFRHIFAVGRAFETGGMAVAKGSAESLSWLPDNCIDYIFADPPFGGNIFYADASMLYEAWLGDTTDEGHELVFHRRSKQQRKKDGYVFKTLEDYAQGMTAAFREMFRVLKPGRWATIEFNNSDGMVFETIKEAVRKAGFEIANMLLLDKQQKTFKQLQGAEGTQDVVDKDVLFNLHKHAIVRAEVRAKDHDLEQQLTEVVRQHLQTLPERIKADPAKYNDEHRTTATINSMSKGSRP